MRFSFCLAAALLAGIPAIATAQDKPVGLTLEQYQKAGRLRMSALDADGDGKISEAEFSARGAGGGRRAPAAATAGEPKSATTAATPAPAGMRPTTDDNGGDGGMAGGNGGGGRGMGGGGRMAGLAFARFDANHDGALDKTEIDAMLAARFNRLDANHDGILTEEERRARPMGRMGAGGAAPEQ